MAAKGGREGREDGSGSCIAGHRDQTGKLLCRPCQVSTRMCTSTHLQSKGESDSQLCLLPERRKPAKRGCGQAASPLPGSPSACSQLSEPSRTMLSTAPPELPVLPHSEDGGAGRRRLQTRAEIPARQMSSDPSRGEGSTGASVSRQSP